MSLHKKYSKKLLFLAVLFLLPSLVGAFDIVVEEEVGVTATVEGEDIIGDEGTGGSGSGGTGGSYSTRITFSGLAYPYAPVSVLKNGVEIAEVVALGDGTFVYSLANLSTGTYSFSLVAEDLYGRRSSMYTFPLSIGYGVSTSITGIYMPPTISLSSQSVQRGDTVIISGQSAPYALVTLQLESASGIEYMTTFTDERGLYTFSVSTQALVSSGYSAKTFFSTGTIASYFSHTYYFNIVADVPTVPVSPGCFVYTNLNADCRVNIVDFSILLFWLGKSSPPTSFDFSGDGIVTVKDFSIMAYYWTG